MNNETIPFEESLFVNQSGKYILSILNEDVKSSSWLLTNGIHKIGRLDDKEIILDDITVSKQRGEMNSEVAAYAWLGAISEIVVQWIENGKPHPMLEAFPTLRAIIFRSLDLGEQV